MTQPMSPAAQAVLAAFNDRYELLGPLEENWQEVCLAAVLRAAVEAKLPEEPKPSPDGPQPGGTRMYYHNRLTQWEERQRLRREFLALADELEGHG